MSHRPFMHSCRSMQWWAKVYQGVLVFTSAFRFFYFTTSCTSKETHQRARVQEFLKQVCSLCLFDVCLSCYKDEWLVRMFYFWTVYWRSEFRGPSPHGVHSWDTLSLGSGIKTLAVLAPSFSAKSRQYHAVHQEPLSGLGHKSREGAANKNNEKIAQDLI